MKHAGAITKITPSTITVALEGNIHCASCKAKAACGVSESNSKEIEIENPMAALSHGASFQLHESVEVEMKEELGLKAVFWAYVFPFFLVLTVLLVSSNFLAEWQAGLLALAVMLPYYLVVQRFNGFFKKQFKVSILKLKLS